MFRFERSNRCAIMDEKPFCIIKILFLLLASMWSEKNGSLALQGELSYYVFIISFFTANSTHVVQGTFHFFVPNSHSKLKQVEYKHKIWELTVYSLSRLPSLSFNS